MTRRVWACRDCGKEWPSATPPPEDLRCAKCDGEIEKVNALLVALADVLVPLVEHARESHARALPAKTEEEVND